MIFLDFLSFCCYISLFLSDFVDFDTVSMPLVNLAKGFSFLSIFLNEPVPGFVDSLYSSFSFYSSFSIIICDFKSDSCFSSVLGFSRLAVVGELGSDEAM